MAKNTTKPVKPTANEGETKPVKAAAAAKPSPSTSESPAATPGKKSSPKAETSAAAETPAKSSTQAPAPKKAAPETPSSNVKKDSSKPAAKKTPAAAVEKPATPSPEMSPPTTNGSKKAPAKKTPSETAAKTPSPPPSVQPVVRKPVLEEISDVVIPKKSPFSPSFLKKQKQRLTDLRSSLLESMEGVAMDSLRTRPEGSEGSVGGMHMGDAGSDAYDRDFALSLLSKEQDALYEINEAIKRIDLGSYGICEMTGKPVNEERLEALPFTRYTREAQEMIERDQLGGRNRRVPVRSVFGLDDEEEGDDDDEEDSSAKSSNSESSLDFMKE